MGNNAVDCLRIRSMSECVLTVVSEMVKKFQFCLEEERCSLVGGLDGTFVLLIVASSVCAVSEACVSYYCS